jgi:formiminotetrahydrofolate cyclodeaminase
MNKLVDMEVNEFLDELASDSPAPGGGSVAALAGALGAALSAMVCNLTVGKEQYDDVQETITVLLKKCEAIRKQLTQLIDRDTEAFNEVMNAFKLPKETEEQKEERKQIIQQAFKTASSIPLETARVCLKVLDIAQVVAEQGNQNSITDAAVSALMAHAGVQGASLNVKINLSSIKDESFVDAISQDLEDIATKAQKKTAQIVDTVAGTL